MDHLPYFPPFECSDKADAGPKWEKWLQRVELLFTGMDIADNGRKRALLLHYAGERVFDIYEAEKGDTAPNYNATKQVLSNYFSPRRNVQMKVYKFRTCKQSGSQTLDEYVTELRKLSKDCEFENVDKEILSQIIQSCKSNRLRRRALREPEMNLKTLLDVGRAFEVAESQARAMEAQTERSGDSINAVSKYPTRQGVRGRGRGAKRGRGSGRTETKGTSDKQCWNCGGSFPHTSTCPAKGKLCLYCKKPNHFRKMCKKRLVDSKESKPKILHEVGLGAENISSSDDDEYLYSINCNKGPKQRLKVNDVYCDFLLDTGASVNVLDEATYVKLGSPKLATDHTPQLVPYGGGTRLTVLGSCPLSVESKGSSQTHKFYVIRGNYGALLGYPTCHSLGLVQIVSQVSDSEVASKYPDLFHGIGKLKNKTVRIHVDESVKPVAQRSRRTPFHLRPKLEAELQKLLDDDIIEKVEKEPTPWISPIVTPPKKNPEEIRLCVDMREANKAIIRERHLMPTVEELIHDLNGASVVSKLDLRQGYHQLELEPSSRYITTFNTHVGIFRYKRLNFGICSASEIFQEAVRSVIQGIPGAKNISDDILVFGKTQAEHDAALAATFKALQDSGLTLNRAKCEFNCDKITFFGLVFSKSGISPDPAKVSAIRETPSPSNVRELRSFLGMTSYCSRFIQDYSTVSEPLRRLTHSNAQWVWTAEQENSFQSLKSLLSSDTVIAYYDPDKDTEVVVDASPVGVGAILAQENRVVAFASRSLSSAESRYSQTEREALSIVGACEHFDIYLRGAHHFTVITDHKPLETIWQRAKPPLRIERWGLRLQPYKMAIKYRPGKDNPADFLSRHPIQYSLPSLAEKLAEQYVHFVASEAVPKAISLDEVKLASVVDKTLSKAVEYVRTGRWHDMKKLNDTEIDMLELQSLRSIRDELAIYSDSVLLRDGRIVLPRALRDRAISIAHEGHQGISRTKSFLRSRVWFPGLNDLVENMLRNCLACQSVTDKQNRIEPFKMSELPVGPWENLSADFCGPLPSGDYLFVVTDEYSRYPVVEIVKSVSANATIPVLDKIISSFGVPKVIKSDNGSPFNSHQFKEFSESIGFQHRRITPRWPRANSQAESFNKPLMKAVRAAHIEKKPWKQELFKFLRQYRSTPHPSTGFAPFTLMFQREIRTKLPQVPAPNSSAFDECARQNDELAKRKMKGTLRSDSSPHDLSTGDLVLLRNDQKQNKLTPVYDPTPRTVVSTKGSMISVSPSSGSGNLVTRNSSWFKKVPVQTDFANQPHDLGIPEEEEIIYKSPVKTGHPSIESDLKFSSPVKSDIKYREFPSSTVGAKLGSSTRKLVNNSGQTVTRSGRVVKKPASLKDYV